MNKQDKMKESFFNKKNRTVNILVALVLIQMPFTISFLIFNAMYVPVVEGEMDNLCSIAFGEGTTFRSSYFLPANFLVCKNKNISNLTFGEKFCQEENCCIYKHPILNLWVGENPRCLE